MATAQYKLSEITDCISLDKLIKETQDKVVALRLKKLSPNFKPIDELDLIQLEGILARKEDMFSKLSCNQKIEYKRMVETGQLLSEQAIKSEESVITKNTTEQYVYIALGAIVLLTGLYIIVSKK
jgi:hypothetical protein